MNIFRWSCASSSSAALWGAGGGVINAAWNIEFDTFAIPAPRPESYPTKDSLKVFREATLDCPSAFNLSTTPAKPVLISSDIFLSYFFALTSVFLLLTYASLPKNAATIAATETK